jgi:hypothetical protein
VPVDASQKSRRPRRRPADEVLYKLFLKTRRQPAPTSNRNHLIEIAFLCYLGQPLKISCALIFQKLLGYLTTLACLAPSLRRIFFFGNLKIVSRLPISTKRLVQKSAPPTCSRRVACPTTESGRVANAMPIDTATIHAGLSFTPVGLIDFFPEM